MSVTTNTIRQLFDPIARAALAAQYLADLPAVEQKKAEIPRCTTATETKQRVSELSDIRKSARAWESDVRRAVETWVASETKQREDLARSYREDIDRQTSKLVTDAGILRDRLQAEGEAWSRRLDQERAKWQELARVIEQQALSQTQKTHDGCEARMATETARHQTDMAVVIKNIRELQVRLTHAEAELKFARQNFQANLERQASENDFLRRQLRSPADAKHAEEREKILAAHRKATDALIAAAVADRDQLASLIKQCQGELSVEKTQHSTAVAVSEVKLQETNSRYTRDLGIANAKIARLESNLANVEKYLTAAIQARNSALSQVNRLTADLLQATTDVTSLSSQLRSTPTSGILLSLLREVLRPLNSDALTSYIYNRVWAAAHDKFRNWPQYHDVVERRRLFTPERQETEVAAAKAAVDGIVAGLRQLLQVTDAALTPTQRQVMKYNFDKAQRALDGINSSDIAKLVVTRLVSKG